MNWAGKKHPVETAAEWGAPLILATASGWSALVARMALPMIALAVAVAFLVGFFVLRAAGGDRRLFEPRFDPAPLERVEPGPWEELILKPEDEILLLDDPIEEPDPASRVVRLFARQEPTPGELVDRIADFLGEGRKSDGGAAILTLPAPDVPQPDATAALHAALANIRASLR